MKTLASIILSIGGMMCLSVQAQTAYTLDQCLDEAVANNRKLRNADNRVAMSEQERKEAFTNYFPTVTATGGGFLSNKGLVKMDMGGMGLSVLKNGMVGGVIAMQPVFVGGQVVNGNKLAKLGEQTSVLQRNLTENEVRLNTEKYFWQIVQLKEKLKTIDQIEEQLANAEKDTQAEVDAGMRNRNDLLQVRLRKNEMRTSRIQVENALRLSRDLLAQCIGHFEDSIDVSFTVDYDFTGSSESLYVIPEEALAQTDEYRLLGKQVEADRLQYRMSLGKYLPSVAVGGGYLYNDLMDRSRTNWLGMVTVSVPLSDWWGGSHELKRKKIQIRSAENERQEQGQMLVIRMRKAWNDVTDACKQLDIAKESIEQSTENLRLNTDYYQAGTVAVSDLLDAQSLYQQSRDQYVEAYTDYAVKKREYLQVTGR